MFSVTSTVGYAIWIFNDICELFLGPVFADLQKFPGAGAWHSSEGKNLSSLPLDIVLTYPNMIN